jgi:hypothetical protein
VFSSGVDRDGQKLCTLRVRDAVRIHAMSPPPNPFYEGLKQLGMLTPEPSESAPADPLKPLVVEVISEILSVGDVVAPIDVLVRLEILTAEQCAAWRSGGLPYLERGITAGLSKVAKLLRLLDVEARAMGLTPALGKYVRSGKGSKRRLRFSKRGDAQSEASYSRHYVRSKR